MSTGAEHHDASGGAELPPRSSVRARSACFERQQQDTGGGDLWATVAEAWAGKQPTLALSKFQSTFVTLSETRKRELLDKIAQSPPVLVRIHLEGLGLDNSHAPVLAAMARRPATQELSVERNNLSEAGLMLLADAVIESSADGGGGSALALLAVANQRAVISTAAAMRLLDAMEASPTLGTLRMGTLRDDQLRKRHQSITMAKTEAQRLRRKSELGGGGGDGGGGSSTFAAASPPLRHSQASSTESFRTPRVSDSLRDRLSSIEGTVSTVLDQTITTIDWSAEADKIARSEAGTVGAAAAAAAAAAATSGLSPASATSVAADGEGYVLTGNTHWLRAKEEERRQVVGAFERNTSVRFVSLANSGVSDADAALWGQVLSRNTTITSLNLESNSISSGGIEALAAALHEGAAPLRELKLSNQHLTYSQVSTFGAGSREQGAGGRG